MLARVVGWRNHPIIKGMMIISLRFITYIMKAGNNYIGFPRYYSGMEEVVVKKSEISVEPNDIIVMVATPKGIKMAVADDIQIAYDLTVGFDA